MRDPVLGPIRTLRKHLIVAQTINGACHSWPGAPKVAATSSGWLVSGPKGVTEAVSTVEALWWAVLRGKPGARWQDLRRAADLETGDLEPGELDTAELALRVLKLGHEMAQDSATETDS
ncbi:hypothetical protein [Arthrobacter sp. ok362]|uniref:hypothetical protein n=1 Tax=Arthrobacter sp. ok362 TaxID=1761745 RepID=UPI000B86468E|nr:hypothetical protein [Arthrobacter sp. ok362]